jgi:ribosomal protein L7/L12
MREGRARSVAAGDKMSTDVLVALVAAVVVGFILGQVIRRRDDARIVWTEPVDLEKADDDVKAMVQRGQIIQAIKRHRELTGAGLKEAKDYVDALKAQLPRANR